MKNSFIKSLLIVVAAGLLAHAAFGQEANNIGGIVDTNGTLKSNLSIFKGATNVAIIPFSKYDFTSKKLGYGIAGLYRVTDDFWAGLRVDRINGFDTSAGVQGQLKADFEISGIKFSPFIETSVGIGSSSLYGSAGPGVFVKAFSHDWPRTGRNPVHLDVAIIADYEHVVQSGGDNKNSNQGNIGPLLHLSF